ncbi:MAG: AAA family ATPase [Spirochaetaceae bacterium]|nr:AAA family ATPase [Spirochaetaceae bacterium]
MASPQNLLYQLPRFPAIPYGRAYFKGVRLEGCLYVDKTRFLLPLEQERFVFFIRPRRFGKTCWLSLLESYYDRNQADDFEPVFGGLDIYRQPTPNRARYVVVRFNFSTFGNDPAKLEREFDEYCRRHVRDALENNPDLFPDAVARRIQAPSTIHGQLDELFLHAGREGIPLYVLIDEYDNFANTILAGEGAEAYHEFTHGGGFYRSFFAALKAGTENGSVERLFVTGVSPVTMDDVTSGFNIGANLSLRPEFNELLGFTEEEVRHVVETYRDLGVFDQHVETALDTMREWYNGYRFSKTAQGIVYNTDMVLHYLKHSVPNKRGPDNLIDSNVRIDYGKLRHLLLTGRQLNGNFDLLRRVIAEGRADSDIVESFPQAELTRPENFLSLLHYFGLLSIRDVAAGMPRLGIPNQTVRRLTYGYLRDAYRDVGVFSLNLVEFDRLTRGMALEGAWRPAVEWLCMAVAEHTGIRDCIQGEKVLQGFLAAYLSASEYYVFHTEQELAKGYADIMLVPLETRYPGMRHGFVIELKYLSRAPETEARVTATAAEAVSQLRGYLADERLARQHPDVEFTGVALVFRGWEMVYGEEVAAADSGGAQVD